MRYLIICNDRPFYSEWILQPDWSQVVMIIDIVKDVYVRELDDRNINDYWTPENLNWQEINFDHL